MCTQSESKCDCVAVFSEPSRKPSAKHTSRARVPSRIRNPASPARKSRKHFLGHGMDRVQNRVDLHRESEICVVLIKHSPAESD